MLQGMVLKLSIPRSVFDRRGLLPVPPLGTSKMDRRQFCFEGVHKPSGLQVLLADDKIIVIDGWKIPIYGSMALSLS